MTKHKHAEMIKAKTDNMDLVVFLNSGSEWIESGLIVMVANEDLDFFICLPQYAKECLSWLNGALAEENYENSWDVIKPHKWHDQSVFMFDDGYTIRIKPRKENRWIAIYSDGTVCERNKRTRTELKSYIEKDFKYKNTAIEHWQFIELEVEVR